MCPLVGVIACLSEHLPGFLRFLCGAASSCRSARLLAAEGGSVAFCLFFKLLVWVLCGYFHCLLTVSSLSQLSFSWLTCHCLLSSVC